MLVDTETLNAKKIYFYEDITEADIKELHKKFKLSYEMLGYVSDERERSRAEYDEQLDTWLLIYNVPVRSVDQFVPPIGLIAKKDELFVFLTTKTSFVRQDFLKILSNDPTDETMDNINESNSFWILIFDVLYLISTRFFDLINDENNERNKLEEKMQTKTSNDSIIKLAKISKNFVVILTHVNANVMTLESLKLYEHRLSTNLKFTPDESEHLNDVLVEAKQSQEMVQLYSSITDKLTNNYNNLINNNLNNVMKFLTIYSIVLTVPTIITGFYGMNVKLPFADSPMAWIITIVITILFSLMVWQLLKKNNLM